MDQRQKATGLRKLFFKISLIFVLCTAAVVAALQFEAVTISRGAVSEKMRATTSHVTGLLAQVVAGPVKFGDAGRAGTILEDLLTHLGDEAAGGMILGRTGDELAASGLSEANAAMASQLSQAALASGAAQYSPDGMIAAMPVTAGADTVGTVAIAMDIQPTLAALNKKMIFAIEISLGVFVVALAIFAFLIRRSVSRPLTRLSGSIVEIASGDYSGSIAGTKRNDEIGLIAESLERLQGELAAAEEVKVESLFKSAAFTGASTAMVIAGTDTTVRYANKEMTQMALAHQAAFAAALPGFDPEAVTGRPIDALIPGFAKLQAELTASGGAPCKTVLHMGDAFITVACSAHMGEDGTIEAYVAEFSDTTAASMNAAMIDAINTSQIRAEFTAKGDLHDGNERFSDFCGGAPAAGTAIGTLFAAAPDEEADVAAAVQEVLAGKARWLRLVSTDTGRRLEGRLSVINDPNGVPMRLLLIAKDITDSAAAIERADAETQALIAEQKSIVDALRDGLAKLSQGDLAARIEIEFPERYQQLREDFNNAIENLSEAMQEVVDNAESIQNEATEISTTTDELSRKTEQTAATLEETAAALDSLTGAVKSAADSAAKANQVVDAAKINAEQSGTVVKETVAAMGRISDSSEKISNIIKVIDDIAFQTNLLALNAGVEAARAGDAGRGFAVVASEVRDLAQRSSEAAHEINTLIAESGTEVKLGVDLVDKTGSALKAIVSSVSDISDQVSQIAVSSQEQSKGLLEINRAMTELDQSTQQNAARFEETTAASHGLRGDATALVSTVSRFGLSASASKKPRAANAPAPKAEAPKPAAPAPAPAKAAEPRPAPARPVAVNGPGPAAPAALDDGWEDF